MLIYQAMSCCGGSQSGATSASSKKGGLSRVQVPDFKDVLSNPEVFEEFESKLHRSFTDFNNFHPLINRQKKHESQIR